MSCKPLDCKMPAGDKWANEARVIWMTIVFGFVITIIVLSMGSIGFDENIDSPSGGMQCKES